MSLSRRRFLASVATAGSAALAGPGALAAPFQVSLERETGPGGGSATRATVSSADAAGAPLKIPSTMPMGSGAPLGGIGTGFVEVRADGCFYEWQIFNAGPWAQDARSTTAPPGPGAQYLRFLLRTKSAPEAAPQLRRLYLRSDESDLYTLPFVQDVQSIDYLAWFPMTGLRYNDPTLPVHGSAEVFSPFIPGRARDSATPGFHVVFTLENTSHDAVEASLAGFMDNPLASALKERRLTNTIFKEADATRLLLETAAETSFPSGIGNMCFSVAGGEHSHICGTFQEYAVPSVCRWETPRVNYMLLSVLHEFAASGRLPNSNGAGDPTAHLPAMEQIDSLSSGEVRELMDRLAGDALLARVFADARTASADGAPLDERSLIKEAVRNLVSKDGSARLNWGTGALASSVHLKPGEKVQIRFTLSWYLPHHLTTDGNALGHMYSAWFRDAAEVSRFLGGSYEDHRAATGSFARTLADTSLGNPLAFAWSSQLSTLVTNTWWTADGSYAIWEGLGCCGLSTTDVDYQGSFPVVALFPELKLAQMRRIIAHQNSLGQVPHTYTGQMDRVDQGFARVDMNPQFVMMVCRDWLWTGDRDYLDFMWPRVVKAMAFTEQLDTNGDGLPDRDTGLQTYDQWRMRGAPAYIASLWIGALRAAVRIAADTGRAAEAARWQEMLRRSSASFDEQLFNGEYYSLWVDGRMRDEMCMTDQVSGEWFTSMIGLSSTVSQRNLRQSIESIFRHNFNAEFGLHNATAPRGGLGLLALNNLQAGGLWSGIEFAFASLLMEQGRYGDGVKIVEAIHRRYLRAGQPWNHVECGGHYSRAMSSWATMLAASGFKPDMPGESLTIAPAAPGEFHAPWVMASGFGTVARAGRSLSIECAHGKLEFKRLKVAGTFRSARIGGRTLAANFNASEGRTKIEFAAGVALMAGQTLTIQ